MRHRLNRGDNREANRTLYMVCLSRMRRDRRMQEYVARRTAQGKSKREIIRCLKREKEPHASLTAYLAQLSSPPRDRSRSSPGRLPDRPYQLTARTAKTATAPQITPIRTLRVPSPVHHSTPRLTNKVTTINTTMDNSTVAANFESILIPLLRTPLCDEPDPLRCRAVDRMRPPRIDDARLPYSSPNASRSWFSCSSGRLVEMISKS